MECKNFLRNETGIYMSRRALLKGMTAGAAGLVMNSLNVPESIAASSAGKSRVSFVTGTDRRDMIYQALKPLEKEIKEGIGDKQVIIKPNFVVNNIPLCATHPDAVRGVLDFLKPIYKKTIIIGESTISQSGTFEGYKNYGYMNLPNEYKVKLIDLNKQPFTKLWIMDENRHPLGINIINTFLDSQNYLISLTRLKTHDTVVATLTLKNIVMGSPHNNYKKGGNQKGLMHSGQPTGLNYNMFLVAQKSRPHLAVLDGVECMEGNGPVRGTPIEHGVALAGTDCIAVDRVGVELMGFNPEDVGYLQWCSAAGMGNYDRSEINIIGPDPANHAITYKPHEKIEWQLGWKKTKG
ncbi:MAG: DUF362 domain-containing protein [Candidatus Latescibacteria bacterium]|jgi:uncharacterized protein (DUF362 family)|nr:DUF362 domain-containing protein [Candidatus Latescibacterota bacterium]